MKKILKIAFVLSIFALQSCNIHDGYDFDSYWLSYGTINVEDSDFKIDIDEGDVLSVKSSLMSGYEPEAGQRIIANYSILSDNSTKTEESKTYDVRLNSVYEILTKEPIKESFIAEDSEIRNDSIGNSPVKVKDVWLSANKYLNVSFDILYSDYSTQHFINLVWNDIEVDSEGYVNVYLRHNDYDDARTQWGFCLASFNISDIISSGQSQIKLRFNWTDYNGSEKSETVVMENEEGAQGATVGGVMNVIPIN